MFLLQLKNDRTGAQKEKFRTAGIWPSKATQVGHGVRAANVSRGDAMLGLLDNLQFRLDISTEYLGTLGNGGDAQ